MLGSNPLYLQQLQQLTSQLAAVHSQNRLGLAGLVGAPALTTALAGLGGGLTSVAGMPGGVATGTIMGASGNLLQPIGSVLLGPGAKRDGGQYMLPHLSLEQRQKLEAAKKYAMDMSIKTALMKQTTQLQTQVGPQSANMKRAQALVLLSRIYVGSINYDVKEDLLRQVFLPFGPIKNISLSYDPQTNKHKGFCFVEYELPESAQLAMEQMNNATMGGRIIKVGRPSNMPNAAPMQEELVKECSLQNRIFIASVHDHLTDDDLKTVFEAFGKITACKLEQDPSNPLKHRGFGFIEYETPQSATDAIASMNNFDLGGQLLRVGRAFTPPTHVSALGPAGGSISVGQMINTGAPGGGLPIPQAAAISAASIAAAVLSQEAVKAAQSRLAAVSSPNNSAVPPPAVVIPKLSEKAKSIVSSSGTAVSPTATTKTQVPSESNMDTETSETSWDTAPEANTLEHQEKFEIRGRDARGILMQKLQRRTEQRVLVLRNMVSADDLDESIEGEVTDECSKFGEVERVIIYQEKLEDDEMETSESSAVAAASVENVIVKIFVVFSSEQAVLDAVQVLNGRFFDGRTVVAERYDQHLFDANDLSH